MAGLYLHIPFCKQACHYCDFHFSTSKRPELRAAVLGAMERELARQVNYLGGRSVHTVYVGGGTPSLLTDRELGDLFDAVHRHYTVTPDAKGAPPEITLEANPDDLTAARLAAWRAAGVNRLSIGIQTFHEPHLRYLNRAHNRQQALVGVRRAQDAGFEDLTIDLIWAIPHPDHSVWRSDLATALALDVPHVSAYCLTIEPRTVFGRRLQKGELLPVTDDFAAEQFDRLVTTLTAHGYEHYEVSNFARPGRYARHNCNYWRGVPYLGIGPSAHSYDGHSRQHNVPNNGTYVRALAGGELPATRETLTPTEAANEYLMTSLRTQWGCDWAYLTRRWHLPPTAEQRQLLRQYEAWGSVRREGELVYLTHRGKLLADQIAADLFYDA
ncbi:MAG: radical SAM family heme chaperone HemW [Catalinimonas sp.]